jgi:hypothetical protein
MQENFETWSRLSVPGLLLTGLGLSLVGHATVNKSRGRGWFWQGTLGLIVFNAGLAIFGEAVKARALYEAELNQYRHAGR